MKPGSGMLAFFISPKTTTCSEHAMLSALMHREQGMRGKEMSNVEEASAVEILQYDSQSGPLVGGEDSSRGLSVRPSSVGSADGDPAI
jgi:hypothetical protein